MNKSKLVFRKTDLGIKFGIFKVRKDVYIYIPLENKKIATSSLNLYNPSHNLKKIYKKIIKKMSIVSKYLIPFKSIKHLKIESCYITLFNKVDNFKYFCVYSGTPGNTQKNTIQLMNNNGDILGFCKVPISNKSEECVLNEYSVLKYLSTYNLKYTTIPKILCEDLENKVFVQSNKSNLKERIGDLDEIIVRSLYEISSIDRTSQKYKDTELYENFNKIIKVNNNKINLIKDRLIEYISLNKNNHILLSLSHQDFTSWNTKELNGTTYVFDWEFSKNNLIYYDIIHFIYFEYILVYKMSIDIIIKNIIENKYICSFKNKLNIMETIEDMFILYLIELIYNYMQMNDFNEVDIDSNYIINISISILDKLLDS